MIHTWRGCIVFNLFCQIIKIPEADKTSHLYNGDKKPLDADRIRQNNSTKPCWLGWLGWKKKNNMLMKKMKSRYGAPHSMAQKHRSRFNSLSIPFHSFQFPPSLIRWWIEKISLIKILTVIRHFLQYSRCFGACIMHYCVVLLHLS